MKKDPFVEILNAEFRRKKMRNDAYSLRSFARYLDIDPSNLSKVLSHRKAVGRELKTRIAERLGLIAEDLEQLQAKTRDQDYSSHSLEVFQAIADWEHYAILEILKIRGVDGTPKGIAKRLNITLEQTKAALGRLKKLGMLSSADGKLVAADESSSSITTVPTSAAHKHHQREILAKAIDALEKIPIDQRSQSSMTLAIDSSKLNEARGVIKKFRRDLGRLLSSSDNLNEVYHLSVSLYPVTQPNHTEENL